MTFRRTLLCLTLGALSAQGQNTQGDVAAFTGIMLTPVGALPMLQVAPAAADTQAKTLALRFGTWQFDGAPDRNYALGTTLSGPVGKKASMGGTLAYFIPGGDDDGTIMAGVDYQKLAWESLKTEDNPSSLTVAVRGDLGYGRFLGSGGSNFYSLVGSVPLRVHYKLASGSNLLFHLTPGFGFGGYSEPGDSEFGTRPMVAFGGGWTSVRGVGFQLGAQQVMINGDPPWVWGLSGTMPVGR